MQASPTGAITTETSTEQDSSVVAAVGTESNELVAPASIDVSPEGETEEESGVWYDRFDTTLSAYLSKEVIAQIKQLYLEGPDPPFVSDAGWEGRKAKADGSGGDGMDVDEAQNSKDTKSKRGRKGKGRRGQVDNRKVLTDVSDNFDS